jgi:hypothetical protein
MAGTNLLVFLFGRRLAGSAAAGLAASLMYLVYPGPYLEAAALTNDHLSAFLLLAGAYLVVVAYAVLHLAIEVQPRYRYLAMPPIFALTAPAWACLATAKEAQGGRLGGADAAAGGDEGAAQQDHDGGGQERSG